MKKIKLSDEHEYSVDGKKLPAVTTITGILGKPALMHWAVKVSVDYIGKHLDELKDCLTVDGASHIFAQAKKEADRIKDEAGDVGTLVHEAIQAHYGHTVFDLGTLPDSGKLAYNAFLDWETANKMIMTDNECEIRLHNDVDGYCGTLDMVAQVNGKWILFDWKTGSGIYPDMDLQIGGYAEAWNSMHPDKKVSEAWIINITKEGALNTKFFDESELQQCRNAFQSLLKVYKFLRRK